MTELGNLARTSQATVNSKRLQKDSKAACMNVHLTFNNLCNLAYTKIKVIIMIKAKVKVTVTIMVTAKVIVGEIVLVVVVLLTTVS
jgi:hypothetical protein